MRANRLLILLSALAAACGGAEAPTPDEVGGAVQRLALEPLGAVEVVAPKERQAASWPDVTAEGAVDDWDFGVAQARAIPFENGRVLAIPRSAPTELRIPAALAFQDAPRVTLTGIVRGQGFSMRARLERAGETVLEAKGDLIKSRGVQTFTIDFPPAGSTGAARIECDTLVLDVPRGDLPLALLSLAIDDVPAGGYLPPEAFGGLALVEIGSDARRATVISTQAGARASFLVEDPRQRLEFDYAAPAGTVLCDTAPGLRLRLEADGEVLAELDRLQALPTWSRFGLELGGYLHRRVTATFEVACDEGEYELAVLGQPRLVRPLERPPTVLLITSDTHRADHLGFLGGEGRPRTDLLDRLADEGVSFLDAAASINNTTPSHVALFTGLTPRDTGIVSNATRLAEEAPTLADRFAELGYSTIAAVSAAPVCSQFSGLGQGFDRYSNPSFRSARDGAETLAQLLEWLPDYADEPLFVWLHVYDAHSPYSPPEELVELYYPADLRPHDPASPVADFSLAPDWDPTIADPVYTESLYKGEVSYVDQRLAQLFENERFWRGVVAFTADHGETLRDGGDNRFSHRGLSRANLAVPLILRAPGLAGGERRSAPVRQIDVGRTLLDLAGHPEVDFPGRNLLTVEEGERAPRFGLEANGYSASILDGPWMLVLGLRPSRSVLDRSGGWLHAVELYDVVHDEANRVDLSAEHPELTRRLRAELVEWLSAGTRGRWEEAAHGDAADIERQLSELGYAAGAAPSAQPATPWFDRDCACENCRAFAD